MDELIRRAQAGDERALSQLYDAGRARVFRLALALIGSPADAEEVMQDTLHYALQNIRRFDAARSAWPTWLHTITVSSARRWRCAFSMSCRLSRSGACLAAALKPRSRGSAWA